MAQLPLGTLSMMAQLSPGEARRLAAEDTVPVLIDTTDLAAAEKQIRSAATEVRHVSRNKFIARLRCDSLKKLAGHKAIRFIEASYRLRPHLDLAHVSAHLQTQAGKRLVDFDGQGVLVGIVDTGIDVTHPAFGGGAGAKGRIVEYFDQTLNPGRSVLNDSNPSPDDVGHGTHVAGITAGNGQGSPGETFLGVAPATDIAMIKTTFDTADIAVGVAQLFELAKKRKQPCVVNLSLGGHYGGRDGATVLERVIDDLCDEQPGRVVVVSAGNEGDSRIHAGGLVPRVGEAAAWSADFELTPGVHNGQLGGLLWLQVWTYWEDDLLISIRTPNGELLAVPLNSRRDVDRVKFALDLSHEVAPYSHDNVTTVGVFTVPDPQWLKGWSIIVEPRSADPAAVEVGRVHSWILQENMGRFNTGFARSHLVGMPGTCFSAITVASYATKREWSSQDPDNVVLNALNLEDISYFSSPGPTRENGTKPDVAAPGQWLISALSSKASLEEMPAWLRMKNVPYAALQGTSMAAPYITGAIALLLQKELNGGKMLHWAEVKRRLIKSVRQDNFSTGCWNERWGYGKIDIQRLLTIEPT